MELYNQPPPPVVVYAYDGKIIPYYSTGNYLKEKV
jgi:hypothetical protein